MDDNEIRTIAKEIIIRMNTLIAQNEKIIEIFTQETEENQEEKTEENTLTEIKTNNNEENENVRRKPINE